MLRDVTPSCPATMSMAVMLTAALETNSVRVVPTWPPWRAASWSTNCLPSELAWLTFSSKLVCEAPATALASSKCCCAAALTAGSLLCASAKAWARPVYLMAMALLTSSMLATMEAAFCAPIGSSASTDSTDMWVMADRLAIKSKVPLAASATCKIASETALEA